MDSRTILTKITSKGQTVTITASIYLKNPSISAKMDGKTVGHMLGVGPKAQSGMPAGFTHTVCGTIALTPSESEECTANWEAFVAEWKAQQSPDYRKQRAEIIRRINGAMENAQNAKNRGWESGEGSGQWANAGAKFEIEAQSAREELAKFDEEHPEVLEQIEAERKASVAKHIWD